MTCERNESHNQHPGLQTNAHVYKLFISQEMFKGDSHGLILLLFEANDQSAVHQPSSVAETS